VIVRRGDTILIVVPGELGKPRPAVVVQADDVGSRRTVIVCPLSSSVEEATTLRPVIKPTNENGLRSNSQIMTDKITAVRRDRVRSVLGRVEPTDLERLEQAILFVLGLAK
jgi:mRNA interferase MazF